MNGAKGAMKDITPGNAARADAPILTIPEANGAKRGASFPIPIVKYPPASIMAPIDDTNVPNATTTGPIAAANAANLIMLSCWAVDSESHFCVRLSTTSSPF